MRTRSIFITLCVLALVSCASVPEEPYITEDRATLQSKAREKAQLYFSMGESYENHGRLIEATENFQNSVFEDPIYEKAQFALGKILIRRGFVSLGLKHIEKALSLKPDYTEARNFLAYYFYEVGQYNKARTLINKSAKDLVYPEQEETWSLKLKLDAIFNRGAQLKSTVIKALATPAKSCKYRMEMAKTLYKKSLFDLALSASRSATDLCRDPELQNRLSFLKGLIFMKKKDFIVAQKLLSQIKTDDESLKRSLENVQFAIKKRLDSRE